MSNSKIKIVVVCGPTASGKSRLAVDIARRFNGEVINADSMQVYRGMDIANAMPSEDEKMGIAHHLFGFVEQTASFSVAEWLVAARGKIAEVAARSALPVVVGGTGLYISSLVDNIIFDDIGRNLDFRKEMERLADEHGNAFLLKKLHEVDPEAASRLHENNVKRIIRALETFELSGKRSAERLEESRIQSSPYEVFMLGLNFDDRNVLYERIDNRVNMMISNGLVEEAEKSWKMSESHHRLKAVKMTTSVQAIGHKELLPYFRGEDELRVCIENLKAKTRNYAKRQMTWFRKDLRIKWMNMNVRFGYVHVFEKTTDVLAEFV